jgi:hypothetical protein
MRMGTSRVNIWIPVSGARELEINFEFVALSGNEKVERKTSGKWAGIDEWREEGEIDEFGRDLLEILCWLLLVFGVEGRVEKLKESRKV